MLPGVGVFGTNLTARVIIPLLKDEGFAVKALWGRTQEEAEELAKEMSVPFYTSRIDEVLLHQDVDLVCINLPPPLTRQIAVKTLGTLCLQLHTRLTSTVDSPHSMNLRFPVTSFHIKAFGPYNYFLKQWSHWSTQVCDAVVGSSSTC
uniref:Glucose-fructose oxidoreductase domain containing 1 n=1 Tax=Myotis myotis TaxID=51298 RepID=A0A7J7ZVQ0_MYOMY|nr:glucose-fructose oxidoreductase domain containing 1 [Myotis myotis]